MWSPSDVLVTVRQARNLLVKGKNGTNDAYATIEFGKEKFATSSEKSNSPRWFTECTFTLPQGGVLHNKVVLSICIYHKRHGKLGLESDEFIGQAQIPLSALNACDNKERSRWYTLEGKKKDNKKERGDVEVAFKFLSLNRSAVIPTKKTSSKPLKVITSGFRDKLRRRSEDEDSGVGDTERFSPGVLGKGRSCENLTSSFISDSSNSIFERNFRTSSVNSSPGGLTSARGSGKLQSSNPLAAKKALSVGVLTATSSPSSATSLTRSNSGGGRGEKTVKHHVRNRSMPDYQLKTVMGQLRKNDIASKSEICINGSHFYVPAGTHDSGNCSSTSSPEMSHRSSSLTNVSQTSESSPVSPFNGVVLDRNKNHSNSASKRHSMGDMSQLRKQQIKPLPTLYKPKNYYRLDVKELRKVSTIHEDCSAPLHTMTHEDLVRLAAKQQQSLNDKDRQIRELEDYIDSLLVRVMFCTPQILDSTYDRRDDMF